MVTPTVGKPLVLLLVRDEPLPLNEENVDPLLPLPNEEPPNELPPEELFDPNELPPKEEPEPPKLELPKLEPPNAEVPPELLLPPKEEPPNPDDDELPIPWASVWPLQSRVPSPAARHPRKIRHFRLGSVRMAVSYGS